MKTGDTLESAAWLTGMETPALRQSFESRVREAIDTLCREMRFEHGPVSFHECQPGDERVPPVPDHVSGPDVRLLVAEAEITAKVRVRPNSFLGDLERKDLARLRRITKRSYRDHFPHRPPLTLEQCDAIIEEMGPSAAFEAVKHTMDQGKLN